MKRLQYRALGFGISTFGWRTVLPQIKPIMFGTTTRRRQPALVDEWSANFQQLDRPSIVQGSRAITGRDDLLQQLSDITAPSSSSSERRTNRFLLHALASSRKGSRTQTSKASKTQATSVRSGSPSNSTPPSWPSWMISDGSSPESGPRSRSPPTHSTVRRQRQSRAAATAPTVPETWLTERTRGGNDGHQEIIRHDPQTAERPLARSPSTTRSAAHRRVDLRLGSHGRLMRTCPSRRWVRMRSARDRPAAINFALRSSDSCTHRVDSFGVLPN